MAFRRLLISLALAPILGLLVLAAGRAQTDPGQGLKTADVEGSDIARGRAVAVAATGMGPDGACFRCHGMDGKGDAAAVFPRLSDQAFDYLYQSMRDYASGARQDPIMTPIAQALSEQQMRDVSAYYAAQTGAPFPPTPGQADPQLLQYGGAVAAIGNADRGIQGCINCHGPAGAGLPPTYPYLAGQFALYMEAQMRAWKDGTRRSDRLSAAAMGDIARRMTEEDIRAVSLYYASIRPEAVTPERFQALNPMTPPLGAAQRSLAR